VHRYTLNRLRKEIEPVSPADFMRFLFVWQKVAPEHKVEGPESRASRSSSINLRGLKRRRAPGNQRFYRRESPITIPPGSMRCASPAS